MPIRPENVDRYPADWPAIALRLKEAAGWRCECTGECGRGHANRCPEVHGQPAIMGSPWRRIVIGVAHLNHTPEDCSDDNLRVMCSGCHLLYDTDHHAQTRREVAERQLLQAGQLDLGVNPLDTTREVRAVSSDLTRKAA